METQELGQERSMMRQSIIKLFEDNDCLGDLEEEIETIISCDTLEDFGALVESNQIIRENFQDQLKEILRLRKIEEVPQQSVQEPNPEVVEKKRALESEISEYKYLVETVREIEKIEGLFSYKHSKTLELWSYIACHPELREQQDLKVDSIKIDFADEMAKLKSSIESEGRMTAEITQLFDKIGKTNETLKINGYLAQIRRKYIFLNIDQFNFLIKKSREAGKSIFNENAIVFIGFTGAGKSTTILSLLGHEMVLKKTPDGLPWVTPKSLLEIKGVKNLIGYPSSKSVTRNITSMEVPQDMYDENFEGKMYFIDTAGFKDTEGPEVDLSNMHGAAGAIKSLKQARFVLLVSGKDQGSRFQGLIEIIQIMNLLFPTYKEVQQSVVFVFNRLQKDQHINMNSIVKVIFKQLPPTMADNPNIKSIYADLLRKTQNPNDIIIFDPVGKSKEYSKQILQRILNAEKNTDLNSNFSVCYTERTKSDIEKQCSVLKDLCLVYLEQGKLLICRYFISELERLYELLGKREAPEIIQSTMKTIDNRIVEIINVKYTSVINNFNKFIATCALSEADVKEYLRSIDTVDLYDIFKGAVKIPNIKQRLTQNANDKISLMFEDFKNNPERMDAKTISSFKLLLSGFNKEDMLVELQSFYKEKLDVIQESYEVMMREGQFDESVGSFKMYSSLYGMYNILSSKESGEKGLPLDKIIIDVIDKLLSDISLFIQNLAGCNSEKFKSIAKVANYLAKIEESFEYLRTIKNSKEVLEKCHGFTADIRQKVQKYYAQAQQYLNGRGSISAQTVHEIKRLSSQKDDMKEIPQIKMLIIQKSNSIGNTVNMCKQKQTQFISQFVDEITQQKIDYPVLKRKVNRLIQAIVRIERVSEFLNQQQTYLGSTSEKIGQFFEQNANKIQELRDSGMNLENGDIGSQMKKLGQVLEVLLAFKLVQQAPVEAGEEKKQSFRKDDRPKLFMRQDLIDNYNVIKQNSESIFEKNIKEIETVVLNLKSQNSLIQAEPLKFHSIKLEAIEECLNFIEMGKRIFNLLPGKLSKFETLHDSFSKQISEWETQHTASTKRCFEELKKDQISTDFDQNLFRSIVKNLKKKINSLQEINIKYSKIKKILNKFDRKFLETGLVEQIEELYLVCQKQVKSANSQENDGMIMLSLGKKFRILTGLDMYLEDQTTQQFYQLQESVKEVAKSKTITLQNKLNYSIETGNYSEIISNLQSIFINKKQLYEQSELKVCGFMKNQVSSIIPRKSVCIETTESIEPIIDMLQNLVSVKRILQQTKIDRNMSIFKVASDIKTKTDEFQERIKGYYESIISQTEALVKKNKLSEAHSKILELKKIQKILEGSEFSKNLQVKKVEDLNSEILLIIDKYSGMYIKAESIDYSKFKEDYECLFDSTIQFNELLGLKKGITDRIATQMNNKVLKIYSIFNFNQEQYSRIREYINRLPEDFRGKKECLNLEQEAKKKFEKRQNERKEMNQQAEKLEIFVSGHIDPNIIEFIKDPEALKTTKQKVINKLKSILSDKIKYDEDNVKNYFKQIFECSELVSPKESNKEFPDNQIVDVYKQISTKIHSKISQLVNSNLSKQESILTDTDNSLRLLSNSQSFKQFCSQLIEYTNLLNEKFVSGEFPNTLKQTMESRTELFIGRIFKHHTSLKTKVNGMKIAINTNKEEHQIASEIKNTSNIKIIQDFVDQYLSQVAKQGEQNPILNAISKKITEYQGEFVIPEYKKSVEQNILPKLNQYLGFSLVKNNKLINMDENEIQREFKNKNITCVYLSSHVQSLLNSVGIKDGKQKLELVRNQQTQLKQQSEQLRKKALDFSNSPIPQNDTILSIRKLLVVIGKYSQYHGPIANTKESFNSNLQSYYSRTYQTLTDQIKSLQKHQTQNAEKYVDQKKNLEKANKQSLQKRTDDHKAKLRDMKSQHSKKTIGVSQKKVEEMEKIYKGEVESEDTLFRQTSQYLEKEINEKLEKLKNQQDNSFKAKFEEFSKEYQKLVSVTNTFQFTKEFLLKNKEILLIINKTGKKKWLKYLVDDLNNIGSATSEFIISENKELRQLSELHFKKNILSITIQEALDKLVDSNSAIDLSFRLQLQKQYSTCYGTYQKWITEFQTNQDKQKLVAELKKYVDDPQNKQKRVNLLAMIFALWTIITSVQEQQSKNVIFVYQPHVIQMLSAILLLGLSGYNACAGFQNRFAEIQTGQGKSLILAVASTFFALCKYEVDCVCYSQTLSKRDKEAFSELFATLQVETKIKYCTFNDLMESFTNNEQISLRNESKKLIKNSSNSNGIIGKVTKVLTSKYTGKFQNRVLLMDEADVFFIDQFYGNTYTPSAEIRSPAIKQLYTRIWALRNQGNIFRSIEQSVELKKVLSQFPQFESLIRNHVPHMINGMKNYSHEYEVVDRKITYKDQDGYSDKISYGYKTVFAYFYEHSRKVIAELPFSASSIDLALCEVSYAELPKMYNYIVGVTGTLENLSQCKKQTMKNEYNIEENYIIPSVYKESKREDKGYLIVPRENHYQEIVKNMKENIKGRRPIMIFFENLYDAIKFYESDVYREYQKDTVILNEKNSHEDRKIKIIRAMGEGKISLITKAFARGIDFIIYEKNVIANGGCHLIVAYTISEKSQEIQILGRVARQGDPGSSIFIITEEELQDKLGLKISEVAGKDRQTVQMTLDWARNNKMTEKQEKINIEINKCKIKHEQSLQLFVNMLNDQLKYAIQSIIKLNILPVICSKQPIKTVLAIDATFSMSSALQTTRTCLAESFRRVYQILKQNKVEDGFEMQLVVYRNYNVTEKQLMEMTPFQTSPDKLIKFLKTIQPMGGWGSEALEVVYNHCLEVEGLKQIIVITDAQINTKEDTIYKRKHSGESYWSKTPKFHHPLDSESLFQQIKSKSIQIQTLPIGGKTLLSYYEKISKETNGKCEAFEPFSSKAVANLTDFISMSILSQFINSDPSLDNALVECYRKTYKGKS